MVFIVGPGCGGMASCVPIAQQDVLWEPGYHKPSTEETVVCNGPLFYLSTAHSFRFSVQRFIVGSTTDADYYQLQFGEWS